MNLTFRIACFQNFYYRSCLCYILKSSETEVVVDLACLVYW